MRVVNAYAQECLSGVHAPQLIDTKQQEQIHLERLSNHLHRLVWHPASELQEESLILELSTLQVFDLVEAVDQFLADTQTLPDLTLSLKPVSRRYRQSDEPLVQRVVPLGLGLTGLALAGFLSFVMPIPEVRKPEPKPRNNPTETIPIPQTEPPTIP